MSLSYYNAQAMAVMPKLYVCKTSKETVGHIKDFYNAKLTVKFSALNTLEFTIPAEMYVDNVLQQNELVDRIKPRYLIKMQLDKQEEYFVVMKTTKFMEQDGFESVTYQCYSMGVQIASSLIRNYEETTSLSGHVNFFLEETNWKLDYVDVDFDMKDREYEMSSGNALQCIFDICEKYNAAVVFNTLKKTVNFHHPKNVGKNRGLYLKQGRYLESFNIDIDAEAIATRVYAYGAEGIDLRTVIPTGSEYLEDYSYFLYPFQHDDNWNVLKKSAYMSDSLCIAILKYNKKLQGLEGQFGQLVKDATAQREVIQDLEQELSKHEAAERDLLNQRDVINYTYKDDAENHQEWKDVIAKLTRAQEYIVEYKGKIAIEQAKLDSIMAQIDAIKEDVKTENNFTVDQIKEWADYWHKKEYFNDSIIDEEDLLEETKKVFDEFRQPPIALNLSIEDFSKNFDFNLDYDKLNIGDIIRLTSKNLSIAVTAKITEISFSFDSSSVSITVANTEAYNSDMDKFIESLNLSVSTSTQVNMDKIDWNKGKEAYDEVSKLLDNAFDAAKQLIQGGLNGSVTLSERGLVSVDMLETSTWLMITNGQLLITPDNGNHVSVAISKNGVHAERIVGRLILGNKLIISDDAGTFTINGNLLTVRDTDGNVRVRLGEYQTGKYGLQLFSRDGNQVVLDEDGMLQTWQEGRTDNVDVGKPLELYLYIPKETISIKKVLLRFKLLRFRAYSRTTASDGGWGDATWGGGGETRTTTSGGGVYQATDAGGYTSISSLAEDWSAGGFGHNHGIRNGTELLVNATTGERVTFVESGQHTHRINIPNHTHQLNIAPHEHQIQLPEHTHRFEIPSHTHEIQPGIFEDSYARGISIAINDTIRDYELGGKFYGDRDDLDIAPYLRKGMFNKIELFSDQLGRIDASFFAQVMMGFE